MKPALVWDLPTRLFHWLLAAGCLTAFGLVFTAPEHSRAFDAHMLFGLLLLPILGFRLIWGLTGSAYARFRSLFFNPRKTFDYLIDIVTYKAGRHPGHNPVASYAILAMLALACGSVVSGLLIPGSKIFEELHEILSHLLFLIIVAHLLGVLFHIVTHGENIVFSMLTGKKMTKEGEEIPSSHPFVALFLIVLAGTWSAAVVKNYDFTTRKLKVPLVGASLQMGKSGQRHDTHHEEVDD